MLTKTEIAIIAGFSSAATLAMLEFVDSDQALAMLADGLHVVLRQLLGGW